MKIYCAHSRSFNFMEDFYLPLKKTLGSKHELILPHEPNKKELHSKKIIEGCDLIIAEVSYPSTGMGIELGWAEASKVPIIAVYKKGKVVSPSIPLITKQCIEYSSQQELTRELEKIILNLKK